MSVYSGAAGLARKSSPKLYLSLVWNQVVVIWPCEENHHAHILFVCSRRHYSGKVTFLPIYVCPWDTYHLHTVYERVPPTLIYQSFSFTSARQTVSEQCWKQLQGADRAEDAPVGRKIHNVSYGLFDDDAPDGHFHFLFQYNRWIIVFLLLGDWLKQRYPSHPSQGSVRQTCPPSINVGSSLQNLWWKMAVLCDWRAPLWSTITL